LRRITLAGMDVDAERTVAVGSHLDSVPGGGPLDGALGVLARSTSRPACARWRAWRIRR
jgi:hypothetical protein